MNEVRNVLIGFEIGEKNSQIAYYDRKMREPLSVPIKVGTNLFEFPTPEAVTAKWAEEDLTEFIRESLKILGLPDPVRSIAGICVTTDSLDGTKALAIRSALRSIGFRKERIFLQDFDESFYYYGYSQKPEVCSRNMALIRFDGDAVRFLHMSERRVRKPFTAAVEEKGSVVLSEDPMRRDEEFAAAVNEWTSHGGYSGIFITGEGFSPDWARKSIKALSMRGAKVFEGGNLFVKGAAWTVLEKMERHAFRHRVYLGPDLMRSTVGIDIIEGTSQKLYPLLPAGVNWYENESVTQILPDGRNDLLVTVASMDGTQHRNERLLLTGLPERPNRATRLEIHAQAVSGQEAEITVRDLGFGELYPSSDLTWSLTVPLVFE